MVVGVEEGFTKSLVINGVGYRASVGDGILTLQLGYSHDIKLAIPNDLEVNCTKPTEISISGIDKQKVGQFASEVRALRKPEPYKVRVLGIVMKLLEEKKVRKNRWVIKVNIFTIKERLEQDLGLKIVVQKILDFLYLGVTQIYMRKLLMMKNNHLF